jgi:hypothetical protein
VVVAEEAVVVDAAGEAHRLAVELRQAVERDAGVALDLVAVDLEERVAGGLEEQRARRAR